MPADRPHCCWCGGPFVFGHVGDLPCFICQTPACWERIRNWVLRDGSTILQVPLPRQVELLDAVQSRQYRWLLYGGAAGGAKSHGLRWLLYRLCLAYPEFRCLLLRRTYPELEKTHMREAALEAPRFGAVPTLSSSPPIVSFPQTRSLLEFGHCQDEKTASSYLSAQYPVVAFDEIVTFDESLVMLLASRCRAVTGSGHPSMILAGTNPGGVGGLWVKARWIDKVVDRRKWPHYNPALYHYIPSLLDDNPYIDEAYEEFLQGLDPARRAAYRYGQWDVFAGQFFQEFSIDTHVKAIAVPPDLPRLGAMDWGYTNPGVFLWAAALPDGHLHIEREYVFEQTVAAEVGQEILKQTKAFGQTISAVYADPAMWIRTGQVGESIAETLQLCAVPLHKAHHERVNGWQRLRHWLRCDAQGVPWLTISPECPYLIRTLPALVRDEHKPEDVDTTGDDHAADALRYLLMSRPAPFLPALPPEPVEGTAGWLFREACREGEGVLGAANVRA